jgi:hypothetical protein
MTQINTKPEANDFANLVNLMSVYAEAKARFAALENEAQSAFIELVDEKKKDYAELQDLIGKTEAALEIVARKNPDWFADSKTVRTPFGSVSFRKTTALQVANEELTILLVEQRPDGAEYLRTHKELDLEALEKLDDEDLKKLRIKRVESETCTIKPAKVDLGKAVKSAAEKGAK